MGKATTMRNIILTALISLSAGTALGQASRMEATSSAGCVRCAMAGQPAASVAAPQGLRIDPALVAGGISRGTASTSSSNSLRIGLVQTVNEVVDEHGVSGNGQGNGIIVSPCLMLTNHHGVFGDAPDIDLSQDHSVEFFFGQGHTSFAKQSSGTPAHWGIRSSAGGGDWTLVRLASCPGKKVGWPELDLRSPDQLSNERLTMLGIAPETTNGAVSTMDCTSQGRLVANGGVKHSCKTSDGWSAAGMFSGDRLSAMHVGVFRGATYAISMAEIFSDPTARALIEADKAAFAREHNISPVLATLTSGSSRLL